MLLSTTIKKQKKALLRYVHGVHQEVLMVINIHTMCMYVIYIAV